MTDRIVTPWSLPSSESILVKNTLDTGRAVFAKTDLQRGRHLLTTTSGYSPLAHVIFRPYRRQVCAQCFAYDRGREWKIRDLSTATAFCSAMCQEDWIQEHDEVCLTAFRSVESIIKTQAKRAKLESEQGEQDVFNEPINGTTDHITKIWQDIESRGLKLLQARGATKPSKSQRGALCKAAALVADADILTYVLSGVIAAYNSSSSNFWNADNRSKTAAELLPSLFGLAADDHVFLANPMTSSPLHDYTSAYLILLSILPKKLLQFMSIDLVINLASRAAHNAFSIRPEGTTDGEQSGEFLGRGVWPEASFFNHSCRPNVRKERKGRYWSFYVDESDGGTVQQAQELCITYLGGDEKDHDVHERRKRLEEQWGFVCRCGRCIEEGV